MSPRTSQGKRLPSLCILIRSQVSLPKQFFHNVGPGALTWTCCTQTQCADSPQCQPPSWWRSSALGMCWGCELQCPSLWQHHWGDGWWWLEGNTCRRWRRHEGIVPGSRCYVGLRIKGTHLREPLTTVNLWCLVFLWEFVSVDPPPRKKCTYALIHNILQLRFQGVQRPFPQICFWAHALGYVRMLL